MASNNLVVSLLINATDRASGVLGSLKSNAGKVATAISGYFGVRFFNSAIKDAAEFEAQMSTVSAVSGATAKELDALAAAAKEMGATTQFTAIESAQALESLGRAGLSASEQVKALPSVLQLAQANGIELAASADFITKAVTGMGLSFDDTARVADVLTKAAASANTSVEGLGSGLAYAAPVAQSLGLTLEQTVAIMAQLANAGIDASRAGTSLNTMMIQFSDPASKFNKELDNLGINTTDFNEALVQLASKGDAGQKAILALGTEAGPALQALLNQGIGALSDMTNGLNDAGGAAAKSAGIMSNNLDGAIRSIGSAWDAIKLQLGQPILKPLAQSIRSVTSDLQTFLSSGLAESLGQKLSSGFQVAVDAAGSLLTGIKDIYTKISESGAITSNIDVLGAAFNTVKEAVLQVYRTLSDTTASITFGDALGGVLTRIIQGVTFLVSAFSTGLSTIEAAFLGLTGVAQSFASGVLSIVADIQNGMAKITFGDVSKRWADDAKVMRKSSDDLAQSMNNSFSAAGKAIIRTADNATLTRKAWVAMGEDIKTANTKAQTSAETLASKTEAAANKIASANIEVAASEKQKAESSKQASVDMVAANEEAAKSVDLINQASKTLNISLAEVKGEATSAGISASKAFLDISRNAGLSAQQVAKVAIQAVNLSRTKGDIDLLRQSFSDVGFEASKHPQLIADIVQKIKDIGGSLEGIPQQWINIAKAEEAAKKGVDDYAESVKRSAKIEADAADARQRQINQENNLRRQEAADNAAADAAKAKAEKEKQDKLNATQFIGFSNVAREQLSQLSAANKDEFKRQADIANVSNQLAGWQGRNLNAKTNEQIIAQLYAAQQKQSRSAANKTVNVNFKANGRQSQASFSSQREANKFLDILKTAGSVS